MDVALPLLILLFGLATFPVAHLGWQREGTPVVTPRRWWTVAVVGTAATLLAIILADGVVLPLVAAILTEFALTLGAALVLVQTRPPAS